MFLSLHFVYLTKIVGDYDITLVDVITFRISLVSSIGRWFPPGTPVSSTRKLISSSFHRLDMTLAVAEALNPNEPNQFPVAGRRQSTILLTFV